MYPQKGPRREKGPFVAIYRRRVSKNELALTRYACHVSEKPCKSSLEDTPREYLARKGPFSLHKPLESCTARRSCHDQRSQGLAHGSQEELGIASALRIVAGGPTTVVAHVCGSHARSRQLPLCGRWRKPMAVSAAASEQCSGAYARPVLRHPSARSVCLANGIRPPAATFAAGASRRPRAQ